MIVAHPYLLQGLVVAPPAQEAQFPHVPPHCGPPPPRHTQSIHLPIHSTGHDGEALQIRPV